MSLDGSPVDQLIPSKLRAVAKLALFATAVTPVILLPGFFFPYVTTRNVFFRLCVEAALAAVLLAGVRRLRDIDIKRDNVLRWLGFFLVAQSIAAVTGLAPWHSLFGDFERMGGVFAWLHLFLFYCLLRVVMQGRDWAAFFRFIVVVADAVVIWGALEFQPQLVRNPLFQMTLKSGSTVGNPGLLAPFLLLACALAVWDYASTDVRAVKVWSAISIAILLFGIAGARNRSSEIGLVVGAAVAAAVMLAYSSDRARIAKKILIAVVFAGAFFWAAAIFVAPRAPAIADRFAGRWSGFVSSPVDYLRTIEWKIALDGFRDRPLFGYGPENHQVIASHHFDPSIYGFLAEGTFDRTHNAWLEILATSGIFGALAMAGVWIAAVGMVRRGIGEGSLSKQEAAVILGAFAAYATYLTFWFFDINSVVIWVALLAFVSSRVRGRLEAFATDPISRARPLAWAVVAITVVTAYLHGVVPLQTAWNLSKAAEAAPFDERLMAFESAFNSSAPQTAHTFPLYYGFLRNAARQIPRTEANPFLRKEMDLAMERGLIEAERFISRNKADDRSHVDAARFFSLVGLYYSNSKFVFRSRSELLKAISISPKRPDTRVLLSGVCLTLRDTSAAAAQLDTAMRVAPDFLPAFIFASRLELGRGNVDSSSSLLMRAINRRHLPVEGLLATLVDSLRAQGKYGRAAEMSDLYLVSTLGPGSAWTRPSAGTVLPGLAVRLAEMLPILYLNAGDSTRAVEAASKLTAIEPESRAAASDFMADVRSGRAEKWKPKLAIYVSPGGPGAAAASQ